jgi:hypothetical protein
MSNIQKEILFGDQSNVLEEEGRLRTGERILRILLSLSFAIVLVIEAYLLWKIWQIWSLS